MRALPVLTLALAALAAGGCSLTRPEEQPAYVKATAVENRVERIEHQNEALLAKTTIYFDFDSSEIKAEFAPLVAAHGRRLAADRNLRVRLEGNTDERGSAEYNVALGERRAQSVKRALLLQGAAENQMTTVSYGEERPVAEGHDETAWAQNRRVEIVYLNAR